MRRGFTLIELMVVLVIIGTIYALAASLLRQPQKVAAEAERFVPERLDRALRAVEHPGYLRLVCSGDRCEACRLEDFRGEPVADPITLFNQPPVRYDLHSEGSPRPIQNPDAPCFEMERFENGAISETLFEYENRFYHYAPFLHPPKRYGSLEAAWEAIEPHQNLPTDRSRYYHEEE